MCWKQLQWPVNHERPSLHVRITVFYLCLAGLHCWKQSPQLSVQHVFPLSRDVHPRSTYFLLSSFSYSSQITACSSRLRSTVSTSASKVHQLSFFLTQSASQIGLQLLIGSSPTESNQVWFRAVLMRVRWRHCEPSVIDRHNWTFPFTPTIQF